MPSVPQHLQEAESCPYCNTKPVNFLKTEFNEHNLKQDVYECNCGKVRVPVPHVTDEGMVQFYD